MGKCPGKCTFYGRATNRCNKSNFDFENFESVLYMKSVSVGLPLIIWHSLFVMFQWWWWCRSCRPYAVALFLYIFYKKQKKNKQTKTNQTKPNKQTKNKTKLKKKKQKTKKTDKQNTKSKQNKNDPPDFWLGRQHNNFLFKALHSDYSMA